MYFALTITNQNQCLILQVGYSSPAESGIMDDLGLSIAEVSADFSKLFPYLSFTMSIL